MQGRFVESTAPHFKRLRFAATCLVLVSTGCGAASCDVYERRAAKARRQIRVGMGISELVRINESVADGDHWWFSLGQCPKAARVDTYLLWFAGGHGLYVMETIGAESTGFQRSERQLADRSQAAAAVPPTHGCRMAYLGFPGVRASAQLDSTGRVGQMQGLLFND